MKKNKYLLISSLGLSLFIFPGCATAPVVQYGDAQALQQISTDFSSSDLQQIAASMVDSLLTFPPIVEVTNQRRPVITVDKIKNKTMQHIDTESVTDSIRAKLVKSGKFRFIDRSTDEATTDEVKTQQDSGLVDKSTAVQFGKQIGAEYMLTGNISEIQQHGGRVEDVYYKFTLNLKNISTGILEWTDEKEIRKVSKRPVFGT
ncbi:MAG: penicillin-binding protein activator LpoB [Candidatus Omnitrophica bacterium]|nr:penicillin-binding protein activator LpoB [Candidatus Omnitrophota bacterium]